MRMGLPPMPALVPGNIFEIVVQPNALFSVPASSQGILVFYPCASTVASLVTATVTAGIYGTPTTKAFHTPQFVVSAATAATAGAVTAAGINYRWSRLCASMVCTTNLAAVGGSLTGIRYREPVRDTSTTTNFVVEVLNILSNGRPVGTSDMTKGVCVECIPNTRDACDFREQTISDLTNITNSNSLFDNTVTGGLPTSPQYDLLWQPTVILIDNVQGTVPLAFQFKYECKVQYLAAPSTYASAVPANVPRGDQGSYIAAAHRFADTFWQGAAIGTLSRNAQPYIGGNVRNTRLNGTRAKAKKSKKKKKAPKPRVHVGPPPVSQQTVARARKKALFGTAVSAGAVSHAAAKIMQALRARRDFYGRA